MTAGLDKLSIHLGQLDDGRWVAATTSSPYFCFTGTSESEVSRLASGALQFYARYLRSMAVNCRNRGPFLHISK